MAVRLLAASDRIVCVSEDTQAELAAAGARADRLSVIENGVGPAPQPRPGAGCDRGVVVTAVGRLVAQKAHDRSCTWRSRSPRSTPTRAFG